MRNSFFVLVCSGILLASCGSHKPPEIPFKLVPNDTASSMIKSYLSQPPTADTSYAEVPKMYGFDTETLHAFTAKSDEGNVTEVNFIIAAYLDERPMYMKNTVLMQIVREKDKAKHYYYYDLRQPTQTSMAQMKGGLPICPPPQDCIPPGVSDDK